MDRHQVHTAVTWAQRQASSADDKTTAKGHLAHKRVKLNSILTWLEVSQEVVNP